MPDPPRDGAEQIAHVDTELERLLHLWVMNRGVLMTPFHNMALMSPATTEADVDRHTAAFDEALEALFALTFIASYHRPRCPSWRGCRPRSRRSSVREADAVGPFASVALGSTGHLAAATVASIVGEDLLGTAASPAPRAPRSSSGRRSGRSCCPRIMARRGRRFGLTAGYLVERRRRADRDAYAVVDAGRSRCSCSARSLIGFGNSLEQPVALRGGGHRRPEAAARSRSGWSSGARRSVASWVRSSSPIGRHRADASACPTLAGPYLVPIVVRRPGRAPDVPVAPAGSVRDRPRVDASAPSRRPAVADPGDPAAAGGAPPPSPRSSPARRHGPDHDDDAAPPDRPRPRPRNRRLGHQRPLVGMFALAPLSGWMTASVRQPADDLPRDRRPRRRRRSWRRWRRRSAARSCSSRCSCSAGAGTSGSSPGARCSSRGVDLAERARVQGVADAVIWTTSAIASLGSGAVVAAAGFSTLGLLGVGDRRSPRCGCSISREPAALAASAPRLDQSTRAPGRPTRRGRGRSRRPRSSRDPLVARSGRGACRRARRSPSASSPWLTRSRMSAPYGSPVALGSATEHASATAASPTGSGWSAGTREDENFPPVSSTVAGWSRRNGSASLASSMQRWQVALRVPPRLAELHAVAALDLELVDHRRRPAPALRPCR